MSTTNIKNTYSRRLDIFVKTLYIKGYLSGEKFDYYKGLYTRHILLYNLGLEDTKSNIDEFLKDFNTLIDDFQKNGFHPDFPIPIHENGVIHNGAHRLACCLYFQEKPLLHTISNIDFEINWNLQWFQKNGFSQNDILYILEEYNQYTPLDLIIIWPGYTHKIKSIYNELLKHNIKILGNIKIQFNKQSFIEAVNDIYAIDSKKIQNSIYSKSLDLIKIGTHIELLIIEKKNIIKEDYIKQTIRKVIVKKHDSLYNTFHWGDSNIESEYIKNIFLNQNNLYHLKMRQELISKSFLLRLSELEFFLETEKIKKEDFCIAGSGSLGVFGIAKVSDIDIILKTYSNRGVLNKGSIDILDYQYYKKIDNKKIIEDSSFHFYFRGFKFINLSILQEIKGFQGGRKKDILQAKNIRVFLKNNGQNNKKTQGILFNLFLIRNLIKVYTVHFLIFMTKKLHIYKKISYLWRKHVLKNKK